MTKGGPQEQSWIQIVQDLTDLDEIQNVVWVMLEKPNINAVSEMKKAQDAAKSFDDKNLEIPQGLHNAIQVLGNSPSGYTGLTVWEAL